MNGLLELMVVAYSKALSIYSVAETVKNEVVRNIPCESVISRRSESIRVKIRIVSHLLPTPKGVRDLIKGKKVKLSLCLTKHDAMKAY
jgi:hypothetical protein